MSVKRPNQYCITIIPEQMAVLRQAAADMDVAYSEIIRWALADYFIANGYEFPETEYKRGRIPRHAEDEHGN